VTVRVFAERMSPQTKRSSIVACASALFVLLTALLGLTPLAGLGLIVWAVAALVMLVMVVFDVLERRPWGITTLLVVGLVSFISLYLALVVTAARACCWVD
jgi:uncharacterized membrane protein